MSVKLMAAKNVKEDEIKIFPELKTVSFSISINTHYFVIIFEFVEDIDKN